MHQCRWCTCINVGGVHASMLGGVHASMLGGVHASMLGGVHASMLGGVHVHTMCCICTYHVMLQCTCLYYLVYNAHITERQA